MKYQTLKDLIQIIEYKDGGDVRKAMNQYWGFEKTQEIAADLGKALDEVTNILEKVPYAQLIITVEVIGAAQFAVSELSDLLAEIMED